MQSVVNVDCVTDYQFSALKGWLHYWVLIRQQWQEERLLPLSQVQIRQDRLDTLMPLRCRLKDKELGTLLPEFKKRMADWPTKQIQKFRGASRGLGWDWTHCIKSCPAWILLRRRWVTHNPLLKLKFVRCLQLEFFAVWSIWCVLFVGVDLHSSYQTLMSCSSIKNPLWKHCPLWVWITHNLIRSADGAQQKYNFGSRFDPFERRPLVPSPSHKQSLSSAQLRWPCCAVRCLVKSCWWSENCPS